MNLSYYEGKTVRLTDINGKVYEGYVADYVFADDNEPEGIAAIDIEDCPQIPGRSVSFNEDEIASIEIMD